jgi:hypothetical protein
MSIENPNVNKGGRPPHSPILRVEIEEAQRHTNSNAAAARYLDVDYRIYKRYAELYGLFESHMNETGKGVDKGFSKSPKSVPLRKILNNEYPDYSRAKLKHRLIARKKLEEKCNLCGFNEQRITDKKIPLILAHKDGNQKNFNLDNLELLCYNCMFLTTGAPSVAYRKDIVKSFDRPEELSQHTQLEMTEADRHPSADEQKKIESFKEDISLELTEEEKKKLLEEIEKELS